MNKGVNVCRNSFYKTLLQKYQIVLLQANMAGRASRKRIFHFLIQPAFHPYTYFTESHWMAFSKLAVILYWVVIKQDMTKISDFIKPRSWHIILYLSDVIRLFCPKVYVAKWVGAHYRISMRFCRKFVEYTNLILIWKYSGICYKCYRLPI